MLESDSRLLLVDDDESSRLLLVQVLTSWGYKVSEAASGAVALALLRDHTFAALLTDLEMPIINGFVLVRQVRAREERCGVRRTPVMAISGHASVAARQECVRLGFDQVLSKPFDWTIVRDALCDLVGNDSERSLGTRRKLDVSPEVRALLPEFVAARQADFTSMLYALENREFAEICRLGHRLKGSGGSFGFPEMSTIGALLERVAKRRDTGGCAEALDALGATLQEAVRRAAA